MSAGECILCLDLGTQCGWALRRADGSIGGGSESFHARRLEGPGARFVRFRRFLNDRLADGVQVVYWEDVRRHSATDAAHAYGGFLAILTAWCEVSNLRYQGNGIGVGTIKKFSTGNGAARKGEMVAWATRQGYNPTDDNHADALAILHYAMARESGNTLLSRVPRRKPLPKSRQKILQQPLRFEGAA